MNQANKTVHLLLGPTAAGKTALAVGWARALNTSIISADSRQCFRELNIGVAKPSSKELQLVHHDFINSHSINERVHAGAFEQLALDWTTKIFERHDSLIMVGGTGLYIKAFCEGLDEMPAVTPAIRKEIHQTYGAEGIGWLKEQVRLQDPAFYEIGEIHNPQRLMRALEVKLSTGRSVLSFRTGVSKQRSFTIQKTGLLLDKDALHSNINTRVDLMMEKGLLEEVRALLPNRQLNALQTVGYTELFDFLDGNISLDEAVALIKKNTRQYAKRQMTWFKKDPSIQWMSPAAMEKIIKS